MNEPLTETQREYVRSCTALAKRLAGQCQALGKFLTRDEIRSEANAFLIQAAIKFIPGTISKHTGRPVKFSSYAYQFIRRNLARLSKSLADDWVRKGVRTIQEPTDDEGRHEREDDEDDTLEANDAARTVERGMGSLSADERRVVSLRFGIDCPGHSVEETATVLGISRRKVQDYELAAMAKMRAELSESP